ncbi:S1C family serine protease [Chryseomicrobium palamuruense]|uniref:S1C family serine protease n=1 Tax=Chryseomicrobium palamuruense TaxID=682973 RepID=A0ABV8UYE6_9BACL
MDNHQTSEKETSPWKSRIKATGLVVIGVLLGLNLSGFYFNEQETVVALPVSSQLEMNGLPDYSSNFKALDPLVMVIEGETGWGSGFLYTDGGYVITNAHVVTDGLDVTVWNSFSHPSDGTVVGISEFMDIALIHVPDYEGNEGVPINRVLNVQPGIPILTISTPYDNQNTGAVGYITGRKRSVEMESASNYNQFIQFDAQVASGSSGGPLFDAKSSEVIGVITQTGGYYEEIKYALPIEDVLVYIDRWINKPLAEDDILTIQENLRELYDWEEEEGDEE